MPTRFVVGVLASIACMVVPLAVQPVRADCGAAPPEEFLAARDPQFYAVPPITTAFLGQVIATTGVPKHYAVRVDKHLAGRPLPSREVDLSSRFLCGEIDLESGRTYLFALTDAPADFKASFVLQAKGGVWFSVTWGPRHPIYLYDNGYPTGPRRPAEIGPDRVPTKLPALIRFLQRKLRPLPDTATEPVPVGVETLPLNPLLLVLAGSGGVFLGRRLRPRRRDNNALERVGWA